MMDKEKNTLYLSSSIAAALVATRIAILSLKGSIVFVFILLNLELSDGIIAATYQSRALTISVLIIVMLVLLWLAFQLIKISRAQRDLREGLLLWAKEVGEFSGDLVDMEEPTSRESEKVRQRIRVIQRFLELLA